MYKAFYLYQECNLSPCNKAIALLHAKKILPLFQNNTNFSFVKYKGNTWYYFEIEGISNFKVFTK